MMAATAIAAAAAAAALHKQLILIFRHNITFDTEV